MLKDTIQSDLKAAMLSGDKTRASVLNMIKSVILNEEIARGIRDTGLQDEAVLLLLQKEAKKRVDAAELYKNADDDGRAAIELAESELISGYLPEQMDDGELEAIVEDQIATIKPDGMKDMGRVIGAVKAKVGQRADGGRVAQLVKQKIAS
ncbi:GatB/YqeY domain-containing protein [Candidatus Saccharibacteria bacterium]|jgi:uncharacterized protein YqeY|nr:GatB/YqeY domain-containing protein [Candidatus Saccharibacteria bacterium]